MTKKELATKIEELVEAVAVHHGATVTDVPMKVGGKMTTTRAAQGGFFDLDAARTIVAHALGTHWNMLLQHMPNKQTAPTAVAALGGVPEGMRVGPDGTVVNGPAPQAS